MVYNQLLPYNTEQSTWLYEMVGFSYHICTTNPGKHRQLNGKWGKTVISARYINGMGICIYTLVIFSHLREDTRI